MKRYREVEVTERRKLIDARNILCFDIHTTACDQCACLCQTVPNDAQIEVKGKNLKRFIK